MAGPIVATSNAALDARDPRGPAGICSLQFLHFHHPWRSCQPENELITLSCIQGRNSWQRIKGSEKSFGDLMKYPG